MKILFQITIDDEKEMGSVEYHVSSSDELYALSQAMYAAIKQHPEIMAGVSALAEMIKDNPHLSKKFDDNVIPVPDFNKILKEK